MRVRLMKQKVNAERAENSARIESGLNPLDLLFQQHHIETTRRQRSQPADVVPRRKDDATLLDASDAPARAAVRGSGAPAHFDEDQRAVAWIPHDQVDLATAASRRSIIARNQAQAR